jgi:hypothetical protein
MPAFALDGNNGIAMPLQYVYGLTVVAQRIRIRLLTGVGEWILDAARGLPYDEWTGADGVRPVLQPERVAAVVRAQIEQVSGVVRVVSMSASATPGGGISVVGQIEGTEEGETGLIGIETVPDPLDTFGPPMWYLFPGGR